MSFQINYAASARIGWSDLLYMNLENIKIGHSELTDSLFIYRHGKDPELALDKRPAERDVFTALIRHMMHESPKGSERTVTIGDKQYLIRVTPV